MSRRPRFLHLLLAPLLAAPLAVSAAPTYTISRIGDWSTDAHGINNAGQVVGDTRYYNGMFNSTGAFVSNGDGLTNMSPSWAQSSSAYSINDSGVAAGNITLWSGVTHGATFSSGTVTDIGSLARGAGYVNARGINSSGQVTGSSGGVPGVDNWGLHAYLYTPGSGMVDIGSLGSWSSGYAINDAGTVVGASDAGGATHAFRYSGGTMQDLGTLGGSHSEANAVNNSGAAVGFSYLAGDEVMRAALFSNGQVTDLGTIRGAASVAYGINNAGEVVGMLDSPDAFTDAYTHAFLYRGGVMLDLNSLIDPGSGWVIQSALGINDNHQILANGCDATYTCASLLLSLADSSVSPVPEPGQYHALLLGLGLLGIVRKRKAKASRCP